MKPTINLIKITMTLTALLFSSLEMASQDANSGIIPDTPPSPQAVAFNRLGDYQVNNNYGAPDINIPLFEIDFHGYKIPLALHYEATPVKPGYNYDVTGLGWTLSGNSCVSRTIKDRADEYVSYSFSSPFTLDTFEDSSGQTMMYVIYKNVLDQLNYQYDSYNIVLPSGRTIPFFMYKYGGTMHYELMSLDSKVRINCSYSSNSIDSFTVTDEGGVVYHFTIAEKATNGYDNDVNALRNVTWLLTSIDIPAKGTITYAYNTEVDIHTQNGVDEPTLRVSRLMSQMQEDAAQKRLDVQKYLQTRCPRYRMTFLKSISYGPTVVNFNYTQDGKHMNEIVVTDNNTTIKRFAFNMNGSSQFGSFLTSLVISGQNNTDKLAYGFSYLNQGQNNSSLVKYTDYWGNICYSNNNKDLGNFNMYFNCQEYGPMFLDKNALIQQLAVNNFVQVLDNNEGDPFYYYKLKLQSTTSGDTRQASSPEYHGVLSSITYPNGGCTLFIWENHRFPTASAANGDFVFDRRQQRIIEGGGFRIKSIVNKKADGTTASEDHYRYGFTIGDIIHRDFPLPLPDSLNISSLTFNDTINQHIGCGEAVVDPNLLTFMTFSYYKPGHATFSSPHQLQTMALGMPSNDLRYMYYTQGSAVWWDAYFSANTFRSLLGGRRPVVYPEITVYHGNPDNPNNCKSKTVYNYNIYRYDHNPQTYYLSSFNQTTLPDTAYFERICYEGGNGDIPGLICDEYEASKRNRLQSKSDYSYNASNDTWNLVAEETYEYNEEMISKSGWIYNSYLSRENRSNYVGALGNGQWLASYGLYEFYKPVSQWQGRSTMSRKTTTILHPNGTRTADNVQQELYSYLYAGVLNERDYTDLNCRIRYDYGVEYDKYSINSYVGDDDSTDPVIAEMKSRNMLASLLSAETSTTIPDPLVITGSKVDYDFYGDYILPSKLYERNGENYEETIKVLSYDSYGNPTEIVDLKTGNEQTGIHSVFLWDAYGRYLMAIIRNATLTQVGSVSQLLAMPSWSRRATLQSLLPNAQIQTWDYLPLIGVSSHTDVNGQTILYEYDGLGRLKYEKRRVNGVADPEILHEYEYNYRNNGL